MYPGIRILWKDLFDVSRNKDPIYLFFFLNESDWRINFVNGFHGFREQTGKFKPEKWHGCL